MIYIYHVASREGDAPPTAYRALVPEALDPDRTYQWDFDPYGNQPSGALVPFSPPPARPDQIIGQTIRQLGSFGTHGFIAFRLDDQWLVFAIWLAQAWMEADGRLLSDMSFGTSGFPEPWDMEAFETRITGKTITAFEISQHALSMTLSDGLVIRLHPDPAKRPVFQGSGGAMAFGEDETLERAVFFLPYPEIWFDDPRSPDEGIF